MPPLRTTTWTFRRGWFVARVQAAGLDEARRLLRESLARSGAASDLILYDEYVVARLAVSGPEVDDPSHWTSDR